MGISSSEGKVNSYKAFAQDVLPRVKKLGYNAIQVLDAYRSYSMFGNRC